MLSSLGIIGWIGASALIFTLLSIALSYTRLFTKQTSKFISGMLLMLTTVIFAVRAGKLWDGFSWTMLIVCFFCGLAWLVSAFFPNFKNNKNNENNKEP